jgi:flagellar hook protein FlgE
MAVIGDNIANVNTTAYKSSELSFATLINQSVGGFTGQEIGSGVLTGDLRYDWNQGTIQKTSSPFDMAIAGNGYFKVMDGKDSFNSKPYYTRDGQFSFKIDPTGETTDYYLMTDSGQYVQGVNGPIAYPADTYDSITVDDNGVYWGVDSAGVKTELGQIQIFDVQDSSVMAKTNNNLYVKTTDDISDPLKIGNPGENGLGAVETSSLEMSNVDIAKEFVNMITAQRAFSANSKVITTSDEILQELVNIKR